MWFDALALCSVFILIPVAMQVNKMNAGREEFIAKNSNFGWAAVGMIILFLPIFILTIIGLFLL